MVTKKTNDPGPGSYHVHGTVGVLAGYDSWEKNPKLNTIE